MLHGTDCFYIAYKSKKYFSISNDSPACNIPSSFHFKGLCSRSVPPIHLITIGRKGQQWCKYFSQQYLSHNKLIINALQNLLFCIPKAALLHGKSVGFVMQKSRFRNVKAQLSIFKRIIFTKTRELYCNSFR
ncbi:hypothetical protein CTM58_04405 [Prevotella intermedia]|uniref:Uncharacterized protein n=1 Tax=Prevotella intermedia TaxID=28131 RepID=A0A2M8TTZ5_PREIN|nr:hypothetical protein CTM58_04405 [Prevotella intermedia]